LQEAAVSGDGDNGNTIDVFTGGHITGNLFAIGLFGNSHTILNSGEIHAAYAVVLDGTGNKLTNHGLITGISNAVEMISGAVTNFGTISANNGIIFAGDLTSTVNNSGIIAALGGVAISFGDGNDVLDSQYGTVVGAVLGGGGNDTLLLGGGNNTLEGGAGADWLSGGAGFDVASYANAAVGVTASLADWLSNSGEALGDTYVSIEGLIGSNSADRLEGDAAGNRLDGGKGADTLHGGAGDDTLNGGEGVDSMTGGAGNDTYYVDDDSGDLVFEAIGGGTDTVFVTTGSSVFVGYALAEGQQIEILSAADRSGTTELELTGNAFANKLIGNEGFNTLDGKGGADTMIGGGGGDNYIVNNARDVVVELAGGGIDFVQASLNYTLGANVENLLLTGKAISGTGNELNNGIYGNAAANTLKGGSGADTLAGGLGNDKLTGGLGNDVFLFDTALKKNVDTITDFSAANDKIRLDKFIFQSLTYTGTFPDPGGLKDSEFRTGPKALDADDHIIYDPRTGSLYYDPDGNTTGGAAQIKFAVLTKGLLNLTAANFQVIDV
jgi:Ca2+-binding RTX toxin-like protein